MNGNEVFQKLSEMTEDERKKCNLMWLADRNTFGELLWDEVERGHVSCCDENAECDFTEIVENTAEEITPDEIAGMLERAENAVADNDSDLQHWDEFRSAFSAEIDEFLERKLKEKHGIEIEIL